MLNALCFIYLEFFIKLFVCIDELLRFICFCLIIFIINEKIRIDFVILEYFNCFVLNIEK